MFASSPIFASPCEVALIVTVLSSLFFTSKVFVFDASLPNLSLTENLIVCFPFASFWLFNEISSLLSSVCILPPFVRLTPSNHTFAVVKSTPDVYLFCKSDALAVNVTLFVSSTASSFNSVPLAEIVSILGLSVSSVFAPYTN